MPPIKRRYIGFKIDTRNVDSRDDFSAVREGEIVRSVKEAIQKLHGDFGTASIMYSFNLKRFDKPTKTGIFAVKREAYQFLSSAIPIVSQVGKLDASLSILTVSGTIRGCCKRLQGFHKMMINHYEKALGVPKPPKKPSKSSKKKSKAVSKETLKAS